MVDRVEYDFALNWFSKKFHDKTGSHLSLRDSELKDITKQKLVDIFLPYINRGQLSPANIEESIDVFGYDPQTLIMKFTIDFKNRFPKGTGGPGLDNEIVFRRVFPHFEMSDETLEVLFDLSKNSCTEALDYYSCIKLYLQFPENRAQLNEIVQTAEPDERFVVIDGVKFAKEINLDPAFLKKTITTSFIPANSKIVLFLRLHNNLIVKTSEQVQNLFSPPWLYKYLKRSY